MVNNTFIYVENLTFIEENMDKKKLIISTAMVILLPLLSALIYVGYDLIRAPSIESEIVKHLLWLQFLSVF